MSSADSVTEVSVHGEVAAQGWRGRVVDLAEQGWDYLEFLTAADWPDEGVIEVLIGVRQIGARPDLQVLSTRLDRDDPVVDSLVAVLPGAAWHEREVHEMFGVQFVGNDDLSPLLLDEFGDWPLRRTTALPARLQTRWPGLSDPADNPPPTQPGPVPPSQTGSRRRAAAVPGNWEQWV